MPDSMTNRHIQAKQLEDVTGAMMEDFVTTRMCEDGIAPETTLDRGAKDSWSSCEIGVDARPESQVG